MILTSLRGLVVASFIALLAGCVTVSDKGGKNVDREKAKAQYIQLAVSHINQGNLAKALRPLERAKEIDPKTPELHSAYAYLFQAQDEPELAEKSFRKALRYSGNETSVRNNYAAFLYKEKRYEDACQELTIASKDALYERRPAVFENLGFCFLQLKQNKEALASFEKAVKLDIYQTRALLEAAWLYYDNGRYQQAQAYYDEYQRFVRLRRAPNNPRYLHLGVKLAQWSGDKNQEASLRLQLKNLFPDSAESRRLTR